ncbi:MAG: Transcriptional regulatory protein YycF [Candidatus Omnitrophica bacterium ADurb.Bin292]|nr:MAG: Transcriptional regulatory protein YycF [Candidatus Omnitrophica bacterium ADurb.Bin292]HOG23796.1 response regulator [Candidatus Omnitrophota bacterium]HPW77157.1 response regulator [Candidatus Omnitrophota bacterium]HQB11711.1 response regulator [Candidatus Omnitrophota bacterium]
MKKKLLLVDDEVEICEFLKSFFEDRDYQVATAHSGVQAVEQVESFRPDVVLLDIQMPEMDGLSALREIKEKYPRVKVIMVTAVETQDRIEAAMRLGADNYITKPLSLEYLEKDVQEKIESLAGI